MKENLFKKTLLGYDVAEVENAIGKLEKKLEKTEGLVLELDEKLKEKDRKIRELKHHITQHEEKEKMISKTLIHAQSVAEDVLREGKEKSERIQKELTSYSKIVCASLEETKEKMDLFHEDYKKLIKKYLSPFNENDQQFLSSKLYQVKEDIYMLQNNLEKELTINKKEISPVEDNEE